MLTSIVAELDSDMESVTVREGDIEFGVAELSGLNVAVAESDHERLEIETSVVLVAVCVSDGRSVRDIELLVVNDTECVREGARDLLCSLLIEAL